MDKVKAFLAVHNISAHTFAVVVLGFFSLYISDADVKNFVDGFLVVHPQAAKYFAVALAIYARYSHSHKLQGDAK